MDLNKTTKEQREEFNKNFPAYHYSCEDGWYSCPKSVDGCLDELQGSECNCRVGEEQIVLFNYYISTIIKFIDTEIERKKLMKTQCDICNGYKFIWETKEQSERGEKPTFTCPTCNGTGELTHYIVKEDIAYLTSIKEKLLK